jgi:hypothetical protein
MGPVGREAGALATRWKRRKRKSRAEARPLQGLVGAGRILVAGQVGGKVWALVMR